jgi:hypothetical protein
MATALFVETDNTQHSTQLTPESRSYTFYTEFVCITFIKHNFQASHHHHVCNYWFINKTFHTEFVGVLMIYLHTQFHMPRSNGSLVIAIKLQAKYIFHSDAMLFYFLQKAKTPIRVHIFWRSSTKHCFMVDPVLSGDTISHASRVYASAKSLLSIVGNWKVRDCGGLQRHNIHTEFHEKWSTRLHGATS